MEIVPHCCGGYSSKNSNNMSIDLPGAASNSLLWERRGGISFATPSSLSRCSRPRLGRRAGVSFDSKDKTAVYVRQLGDVKLQSQQDRLHQYILNNLIAEERDLLQGIPSHKARFTSKFLTVSGIRRRRRSHLKNASDIVDGFCDSATKCLLDKASDWSFDVFRLNDSSEGRPLFYMILKLFQEHNLMDHFNLDIVKLMKFASLVEEGYHSNPYHNAVHAADVTQAMHCYIMQEKIARHLSPLETMVALISAITHDLDHPGVNQKFLIATSNHLASLYKNCSVLENHHWRTAVGILHESALLEHLPTPVRKNIVKQMKSLILATDMGRQQEFFERLKKRVSEDSLDMAKAEDRHFILQIALKCADISNPTREWRTCYKWGNRVCDEFFQQGDYESRLGMPVTSLCNRYKDKISAIQRGFIKHVVEPLFVEFSKFLPSDLMTNQINNMQTNMEVWNELSEEEQISIDVDINHNHDTVASQYDDVSDSASDSETNVPLEVSATSGSTQSELDEPVTDINDVHTNIVLVKERMDWTDAKLRDRRPSLPVTHVSQHIAREAYARRESFPRLQDNRTTCLPHTNLYPALSYDQLVQRLTEVGRDLPSAAGHAVHLDNLLSKPRLSTLSPSIETSKITSYHLSKELMSK